MRMQPVGEFKQLLNLLSPPSLIQLLFRKEGNCSLHFNQDEALKQHEGKPCQYKSGVLSGLVSPTRLCLLLRLMHVTNII